MLGCDAETARQYGEVKNRLRLKGRPLPENDIWIAALALQYDLILVTRDGHFQEVENLQFLAVTLAPLTADHTTHEAANG